MNEELDKENREPIPGPVEQAAKSIIGAAIEVHRHLGPGLLESVYERAMVHELGLRNLRYQQQAPVDIRYKGITIAGQRIDLLVEPGVVVELKSTDGLLPVHSRQVVSYLKSTGARLGLLINFNVPVLKSGIRRIVN
ncbi:MAG: GxxExxY protein [Phycisphaerae bacterium]|jgi:GxxExxY protein